MPPLIRKCPKCGRYSTEVACAGCKTRTVSAHPPRYSPDDRYGKYRRISIVMEYGENGKWNDD
ncbi:MAG: ribosome biogenesis protein [archaeon]|nr:ribosome biogenesis protein [archaeon]